jgi:hypothetical protein
LIVFFIFFKNSLKNNPGLKSTFAFSPPKAVNPNKFGVNQRFAYSLRQKSL